MGSYGTFTVYGPPEGYFATQALFHSKEWGLSIKWDR